MKKLRLENGIFLLFGVVLARLLFPQFSHLDSKTVHRTLAIEPQYQGHWHLVSYVVLDSIERNGAYSDSPQFN